MSQQTVQLKRLTVPQAEANKDSRLFVLNKSEPRGNMNFNISDSSGTRLGIRVPITWIPVDLSNYGQKSDILRNHDFRRLCAKNFFHIIDPQDAEKFLEQPKAKAELAKILDIDNDLAPETKIPNVDKQVNAVVDENKITNPFIQNVILRSSSADENPEDLVAELDSKLDTLTRKDVEDLMNNTPKAEIKTWAGEALAAMA